jgi:hypothetical protein
MIQQLSRNKLWYGDQKCTSELRYFVDVCISKDPAERPRVAVLLEDLQRRKADLVANGAFKYEKLVYTIC